MKRISLIAVIVLAAASLLPAQSLNLKIGIFVPTMNSDLWSMNMENLAFAKRDMVNAVYAAEYEMFLNRNVSFGLEIGNFTRARYTEYRDYEKGNGQPILQNISLKVTPIEAVFTLYMLGHRSRFSPYVALAGGVYAWTYEQWGEFINFEDDPMTIREGNAYTQTVSPGFSARVGFLIRPSRALGFSVEGKYQYMKGTLSSDFEEFEPLDMSGLAATAGVHIYFD